MIDRYKAAQYLTQRLTDHLVVASLGNAKYDLFRAEDRALNFYLWNSMGMACSMGLGMAMAQPGRRVVILDGASTTKSSPRPRIRARKFRPSPSALRTRSMRT